MDKISVIVPVHNSENTIDKCVGSIIGQTYSNIEVILVENSSTDLSYEKCIEWEKKDSRVKVIKNQVAGIAKARNAGLDAMTGDFFAFVDSDDYISVSMYEKLYLKAQECSCDMVCCEINNIYPDGSMAVSEEKNLEKLFVDKQVEYWYAKKGNAVRRAIWRLLYRTSVLGKVRFNESMSFKEDISFLNECFIISSKNAVVREPLYFYTQNYVIPNFYVKKYYSDNFINTLKFVIESSDKLLDIYKRDDLKNIFRYDTLCLAVSAIVVNEEKYNIKVQNMYSDDFWKNINNSENYNVYCKGRNKKDKFKAFLVRHKLHWLLKIARSVK